LTQHRRREPASDVFRLVLPLPFEGLDRVNAYLLRDETGSTLVDCGIYNPSDDRDHGWDEVVDALAACDVVPDNLTRVVVTHPHIDHYGMAGRVVEETGAELWMHAGTKDELAIYRDPATAARDMKEMFAAHGVTVEDADELTRFEDWRAFIHSIVEADVMVADGDTFDVGGRTWQAIHTPGHSRSHICLWAERDSVFISGDHLLPTITPHIDFRKGEDDPLGDFLVSLEKIERVAPRLVLPGHGAPFEDGAERARIVARHHDRRLGAILQVVRNEPRTANDITDELFGTTLLNFERRLALGEALAHIAYLLRRNEIEAEERPDGTYAYKKVRRRRGSDEEDDR
jgi:glyoxylase-like metal-dependent hydrolase (beta-lactamase superfamily II)